MTDQNTFMETVKNVAEIVRTAPEPMEGEEILSYFADMDLDDNQKRLVVDYLKNPENEEMAEGLEADSEISEVDGVEAEGSEIAEDNVQDNEDSTKSKIFEMYLDELATLPKYSNEQLAQMYIQLLDGDESVIGDISNAWLERVLKIAEKYIEPKLNVEDLVQEGNIALLMKLQELAANKEDADVEEELKAAVEQGVMTYASEMNSERELENTVLGKVSLIHEAKKMLQAEKGHEPTVQELADYTKMTIEELEDLEDVIKATSGK